MRRPIRKKAKKKAKSKKQPELGVLETYRVVVLNGEHTICYVGLDKFGNVEYKPVVLKEATLPQLRYLLGQAKGALAMPVLEEIDATAH